MIEEEAIYEDDETDNDDLDILVGLSRKVIDSPEGAQALIAAAQNTQSPAKGAGQFVVMLIENISTALSDSSIEVDNSAWLANDGVLATLTDDIIDVLSEGGVELDMNTFAEELFYVVADIAKGIAQATPQEAPSSPVAQAPLLG